MPFPLAIISLAHWSGCRQKIRGYVTVDEAVYCFMGDREFHQVIEQKYVDVTATATEYYFENEKAYPQSIVILSPLFPRGRCAARPIKA